MLSSGMVLLLPLLVVDFPGDLPVLLFLLLLPMFLALLVLLGGGGGGGGRCFVTVLEVALLFVATEPAAALGGGGRVVLTLLDLLLVGGCFFEEAFFDDGAALAEEEFFEALDVAVTADVALTEAEPLEVLDVFFVAAAASEIISMDLIFFSADSIRVIFSTGGALAALSFSFRDGLLLEEDVDGTFLDSFFSASFAMSISNATISSCVTLTLRLLR